MDTDIKEKRRGRGRPPGSSNRIKRPSLGMPIAGGSAVRRLVDLVSDQMLRAGVEASGGLVPVVYLMGIMGDKDAAQDVRMAAATTLMPYYHKRRPVEVDIDVTQSETVAQQLELVYGIEEGADMGADREQLHS